MDQGAVAKSPSPRPSPAGPVQPASARRTLVDQKKKTPARLVFVLWSTSPQGVHAERDTR